MKNLQTAWERSCLRSGRTLQNGVYPYGNKVKGKIWRWCNGVRKEIPICNYGSVWLDNLVAFCRVL